MYTPMTTAHKSRVLDMTQGDPFRLVLQFSMPLFCSNLLQQLYNLTDTAQNIWVTAWRVVSFSWAGRNRSSG